MPVSMHGLDLSFMRSPDDIKPKPTPKKRDRTPDKRAEGIAVPYFLRDEITPFVAVSTKTPTEIRSRSDLKRYERANGLRHAGDIKPGEIVARNRARHEAELALTKGVENGWTDFNPGTA